MKRILLLAAGALGTAGMIALAAPASAQPSPLPDLGNSEVVKTFLYGNCDGAQVCLPTEPGKPAEVSHPGVVNHFGFFRENLKSQSATFGKSIDSFSKGIPTPPPTP